MHGIDGSNKQTDMILNNSLIDKQGTKSGENSSQQHLLNISSSNRKQIQMVQGV